MTTQTFEDQGVRVAVEGCGHGTLNAIYAAVEKSSKARGWDGVDVLIIGGDFQAVRNAADLTVMSVPAKYREMGDFWEYYSGARTAPYLTIFTAGNHEAASHLYELYYGGWVAPNIYYVGAANVLRLGPLRIAAMSGIWKGFDYRKPHHERLPFGPDDVKTFYHVREIDVRKLLLLRSQVDVGLSHDWPRAIEKWGDQKSLWRMKPDFERESSDGTLGNVAAEYVLDRLRPPYWFSAHLHCKYAALKVFDEAEEQDKGDEGTGADQSSTTGAAASASEAKPDKIDFSDDHTGLAPTVPTKLEENPDEISLDLDDDDDDEVQAPPAATSQTNDPDGPAQQPAEEPPPTAVPEKLRAQLPASFAKPAPQASQPKTKPGQPVPPEISNKEVRFLALDKCLPRRNFLQLVEVKPVSDPVPVPVPSTTSTAEAAADDDQDARRPHHPGRFPLQYDPEWLAITRVFHPLLTIGDRKAQTPADQGEAHYAPLIDAERAWVDKHVVSARGSGGLDVPGNFELTAPPHDGGSDWRNVPDQPFEYTSPQTAAFCEMLGLENIWDASDEERMARKAAGPPAGSGFRGGGYRGGGRGGGGGGDRGFGGRGGRGGGGRRGRGRGRGRGFY